MLSRVRSGALVGVDAVLVDVEVDMSLGTDKNILSELQKAKKLGAFSDRFVYQSFMQQRAFQPLRNEKAFAKFSDSLYKLKKSNKFLNQFRWFKMRQGAQK